MPVDAPLEAHAPANRLRGRRIVVTGAASGIGLATARLFASEGAALALVDLNEQGVAEIAREAGALGFAVDITDEAAVAAAIDKAATALGGIDGVVNCAGIMSNGKVSEVPADAWRKLLEVNLTGTYIVVRSCVRWMEKEPSATIVNVASAAGLLSNAPGLTA